MFILVILASSLIGNGINSVDHMDFSDFATCQAMKYQIEALNKNLSCVCFEVDYD